jgi:hypothetical protein
MQGVAMRNAAVSLVAVIALYFLSFGPVVAHYVNAKRSMPRVMRCLYHPLVTGCPEFTYRYLSFWNISIIEAYFWTYPEKDIVEEEGVANW